MVPLDKTYKFFDKWEKRVKSWSNFQSRIIVHKSSKALFIEHAFFNWTGSISNGLRRSIKRSSKYTAFNYHSIEVDTANFFLWKF